MCCGIRSGGSGSAAFAEMLGNCQHNPGRIHSVRSSVREWCFSLPICMGSRSRAKFRRSIPCVPPKSPRNFFFMWFTAVGGQGTTMIKSSALNGRRHIPIAVRRQGVAMLSSVLKATAPRRPGPRSVRNGAPIRRRPVGQKARCKPVSAVWEPPSHRVTPSSRRRSMQSRRLAAGRTELGSGNACRSKVCPRGRTPVSRRVLRMAKPAAAQDRDVPAKPRSCSRRFITIGVTSSGIRCNWAAESARLSCKSAALAEDHCEQIIACDRVGANRIPIAKCSLD